MMVRVIEQYNLLFLSTFCLPVTTSCTGLQEDESNLIDVDGANPYELNLVDADVANLINADVPTLT